MKTIKVIDLLIKLKNKEEMPVEIIWNTEKWTYVEEMKDYYSYDRHAHLFNTVFPNDGIAEFLNDEVEIIEKDRKIGKLELEKGSIEDKMFLAKYITENRYKINELIDILNDLKKKGKSE